jgi:hypothetical protein
MNSTQTRYLNQWSNEFYTSSCRWYYWLIQDHFMIVSSSSTLRQKNDWWSTWCVFVNYMSEERLRSSLIVELGFGQKFKSDSRVEQIRQLILGLNSSNPKKPSPSHTVFSGLDKNLCPNPGVEQKFLSNPRIGSGRVVRHVRNPTLRPRYYGDSMNWWQQQFCRRYDKDQLVSDFYKADWHKYHRSENRQHEWKEWIKEQLRMKKL